MLESHGIVGATVGVSNRWNRDAYVGELQAADPAMVIVAYGTNEGLQRRSRARGISRRIFTSQLALIEQNAPNASLVIVGPPDSARLPSACRRDDVESITFPCGPLSESERLNYSALFGDDARGSACRWHQPPNLDIVRIIQAQVANQRGHYFWNWSQAMGGACSVHQWAQREPALARRDHIHLTDEGYRLSAEALFRDLTGGGAIASLPRSERSDTAPQATAPLDTAPLDDALDLLRITPP